MVFIYALPCLRFSSRERQLIKKLTDSKALTFPEFLDNFYVRYKYACFKQFYAYLLKYKDIVEFAVYPDYRYDLHLLLKSFSFINWLFPLHKKAELDFVLKHDFTWVAMPYRKAWRDYSFQEFLEITKQYSLKSWILGWWWESYPESLAFIDGFDTTLPEFFAYKCSKIWVSWKQHIESLDPPITKFVRNVVNFHKAVLPYLKKAEIGCF